MEDLPPGYQEVSFQILFDDNFHCKYQIVIRGHKKTPSCLIFCHWYPGALSV